MMKTSLVKTHMEISAKKTDIKFSVARLFFSIGAIGGSSGPTVNTEHLNLH